MSMQLATVVDDEEAKAFQETTRRLGTTPDNVLRMFVASFNEHRGFPYEVRLSARVVEPFETEEEASSFSDALALEMLSDAW